MAPPGSSENNRAAQVATGWRDDDSFKNVIYNNKNISSNHNNNNNNSSSTSTSPKCNEYQNDNDNDSAFSSDESNDDSFTDEQQGLVDFFFQQRRGELDARRLGRVDVDMLVADVDLDTLRSLVDNIAFCHMDERKLARLPDVVTCNAFRVAQLSIEYLANVQAALQGQVKDQAVLIERLGIKLNRARQTLQENAKESAQIRRALRHNERLVSTYESLLGVKGGQDTSNPGNPGTALINAFVCESCEKVFSSRGFLWRHCQRRKHPFPNNIDTDVARVPANEPVVASVAVDDATTRRSESERIRMLLNDAIERQREMKFEVEQQVEEKANIKLEKQRQEHEQEKQIWQSENTRRLHELQLNYESKIRELETRLSIMARNEENSQQSQAVKIERTVKELAEKLEAATAAQAKLTPDMNAMVLKERMGQERQLKRAGSRMMFQTLRNILVRRIGGAWIVWMKHVNVSNSLRSKLDQAEDERNKAKHLAKNHRGQHRRSGDLRVSELTDDDLDAIVRQYLLARGREDEGLSDTLMREMLRLQQQIDKQIEDEIAVNGWEPERQRMAHVLDTKRPYLRARWQHSIQDLETRIQEIQVDVEEEMVRRGGPAPWTISHVDELKYQVQLEAEQESPTHRHASFAASSLVDELTKLYYKGALGVGHNKFPNNSRKFQENSGRSGEFGETASSWRRALSMRTVAAVGMFAGRTSGRAGTLNAAVQGHIAPPIPARTAAQGYQLGQANPSTEKGRVQGGRMPVVPGVPIAESAAPQNDFDTQTGNLNSELNRFGTKTTNPGNVNRFGAKTINLDNSELNRSDAQTLNPDNRNSELNHFDAQTINAHDLESPSELKALQTQIDQLQQAVEDEENEALNLEAFGERQRLELADLTTPETDKVVQQTRETESQNQRLFSKEIREKKEQLAKVRMDLDAKKKNLKAYKERLQYQSEVTDTKVTRATIARQQRQKQEDMFVDERKQKRMKEKKETENALKLAQKEHDRVADELEVVKMKTSAGPKQNKKIESVIRHSGVSTAMFRGSLANSLSAGEEVEEEEIHATAALASDGNEEELSSGDEFLRSSSSSDEEKSRKSKKNPENKSRRFEENNERVRSGLLEASMTFTQQDVTEAGMKDREGSAGEVVRNIVSVSEKSFEEVGWDSVDELSMSGSSTG